MSLGWSPTGMEVIPGKSMTVRLGHDFEKTFNTIGLSTMLLFLPQTWSVTVSMAYLTWLKLVNFFLTPFSAI